MLHDPKDGCLFPRKKGKGGARRGSNKKGRKKLTEGHGNRAPFKEQSGHVQVLFQRVPPTPSRVGICIPTGVDGHHGLKMDMAHLPGPSILFHPMKWSGPRMYEEQGCWKFSMTLLATVDCLPKWPR